VQTLLKVIGNLGGGCGDCHTISCGTCEPTARSSEAPSLLTRRDLGKTVLAASVGALLTGCSSKQPSETPVQAVPSTPSLSANLAVVKQSRGPS
jgi:hypothetical protein